MSRTLQGIAARYAAALKATERLDSTSSVPSAVDIWLYKLEDAVITLINHWANKKTPETGYDHFCLYAHHFCLKTPDDVRRAPDGVLFEAMGLDGKPNGWGWLQFIIRDMGWHSMLAANWGHSTLVIPDGVSYGEVKEEHRRAQAVYYFREVVRDLRGRDVVAEWRSLMGRVCEKYEGIYGQPVPPERLAEWVKGRRELAYFLHVYGGNPPPASVLSKPGKPAYRDDQAAEFRAQIREAAARRRAVWSADWSCDCARLKAEAEEAAGREAERAGIEHALKGEAVLHRADDIGVAPSGEVMARLLRHLEEWTSAEYHIRNAYLQDRLHVFLARNPAARDLLRLPEHRVLAAKVKKEVRWFYLPGWRPGEGEDWPKPPTSD